MKRKKTSSDFEGIRREIARRLQAGLPLAGMIAATSMLCGCDELPGGKPVGISPRESPAACEQKPEQPKPVPPKKNGKSEQFHARTVGVPAPSQTEPNRCNETENDMPAGDIEPPPSNRKNETRSAATRGKMLLNTDK